MEDWDLLAVVRGLNNNNNNNNNYNYNNYDNMEYVINNNNSMEMELFSSPTTTSSYNMISNTIVPNLSLQEQDDLFNTYPHLFETTTAFDELEELYKPFYPDPALTTVAIAATSSSSSLSSPSTSAVQIPNKQAATSPKHKIAKEPATKYKKRKNQQKRVVKEVREDGLSSDMWAWRKYGQKPIKGSPYPRSYYRCSSSKGCSARKQVERSPSDPEIFIITYTAEHSHAHPTRRNSLAGSTRAKFPSAAMPKADEIMNKISNDNDMDCSSQEVSDDHDSCTDVKNVVLRHDHSQLFASLDDLERGLEELIDHDDQDNNDNNKSESLLLDGGFGFDEDDDHLIEANWFVDQYNTTVTGAC